METPEASNMASASENINVSIASPRPESLKDLQFIRGQLTEIKPYAPGFILAAIGTRQVILPAEFQRKLARHTGHRVEVLRCDDEYTARRLI